MNAEEMTNELPTVEEMKSNKIDFIFGIAKIVLLIIGALFLLVPFEGAIVIETFLDGDVVFVESERIFMNFFGRLGLISREGRGSPFAEIIFLVLLAMNIVIAIVSMIPKAKLLKKIYFAVIPLALVLWCIICVRNIALLESIKYSVGGIKITNQRHAEFYQSLVPTLIFLVLALAAHVTSSIVEIVRNKKNKAATEGTVEIGIKSTTPAFEQPKAKKEFTGSVPDELKKYKELLDAGAITEVEYDAKKKELLDI